MPEASIAGCKRGFYFAPNKLGDHKVFIYGSDSFGNEKFSPEVTITVRCSEVSYNFGTATE